jgi:hypothetical protein
MTSKIYQLTLEQIDLIPAHVEKWKNIALSTERLNRELAEQVVNSIYEMLGYKSPIILFFDSPYAACNFIRDQNDKQLENLLGRGREIDFALGKWRKKFRENIYSQIDIAQIYSQVKQLGFAELFDSLKTGIGRCEGIDYQIGNHLWQKYDEKSQSKIQTYFGQHLYRDVRPGMIIANGACQLDYLFSAFNLEIEKKNWETFKSLLQLSNHIFLQEQVCIIGDRPSQIFFDNNGFLHAEEKPAIQFADGYGLYSHHLVTIPKKYGKVHSSKWQPNWLLEEKDWEVRETLVKGIGYVKICRELSVREIDCWQNYLLVAIDNSLKSIFVYLLEINVNTAEIERVKEVPKDVQSVKDAASFVYNYDDWKIASAECKGLEIPF